MKLVKSEIIYAGNQISWLTQKESILLNCLDCYKRGLQLSYLGPCHHAFFPRKKATYEMKAPFQSICVAV